MDIRSLLGAWGSWKRFYVIGIGFSSATIESKIMSGEIMGDGNKGGAKSRGGAMFIENAHAESVDIAIRKLEKRHAVEMRIIKATYVTEWSIKRISGELGISKYYARQLLKRGIVLIEGMLG